MATSEEEESASRIPFGDAENGVAPYEQDERVQGELVSFLDYKDQANSYIRYVNPVVPIAEARLVSPHKPPPLRPDPSAGTIGLGNNNNNNQQQPYTAASHGSADITTTSTITYESNPTATSTVTWQAPYPPPFPAQPQTTGGGGVSNNNNNNRPAPAKSWDPSSENFDFMRFMKKYGFVVLLLGAAVGVCLGFAVGAAGDGDGGGGIATPPPPDEEIPQPAVLFDLLPEIENLESSIGYSVSLDGTGTRLCLADRNFVHVYEERGPQDWKALGSPITPPNNTDPDLVRASSIWIRAPVVCRLSADGKVLAVGWSKYQEHTGYVQAYQYNGQEWQTHGQALTGMELDSCFGTTLDLDRDGGVLAVGSPGNGGSVFVYQFNVGSWQMLGNEIMLQKTSGMIITSVALSIDGETLGIGGRAGPDGCVVEIFRRQAGDWRDKGLCIKGVPEGPAYAVDIAGKDGSIVAFSNYFLSKTGNDVSDLDARAFQFVAEDAFSTVEGEWERLGEPLHQVAEGEKEGYFISMSDDGLTLLMGDPGSGGNNQGHAHIYKYNATSSQWEQYGKNIYGSAAADQFGYAVDLSKNGKRFAIGAPFSRELGTRESHGKVQVFEIL